MVAHLQEVMASPLPLEFRAACQRACGFALGVSDGVGRLGIGFGFGVADEEGPVMGRFSSQSGSCPRKGRVQLPEGVCHLGA